MKLIYNYAESIGINLRKLHNDYHSMASFVVMNAPEGYPLANGEEMEEIQMAVRVPASKWHKVGAPYLDTLSYIILKQDGELTLTNYDTIRVIATCRSTGGLASLCGTTAPDVESCIKIRMLYAIPAARSCSKTPIWDVR